MHSYLYNNVKDSQLFVNIIIQNQMMKKTDIEEVNFVRQIKQNSLNLQQMMSKLLGMIGDCRASNHSQSAIRALEVMIHKIELEIDKYKLAVNKIEQKVMTRGGMSNLKNYFSNNYNMLVKQSHQLLSVCSNQVKLPTQNDFKKVKQLESQLDRQWDDILQEKYNSKQNYNLSRFVSCNQENTQTNNQKHQNLTKMAISQIQQQFLAIRMATYKMYEHHNAHSHPKIYEQLQILKEQQTKLAKEIGDMNQIRMDLLAEQKKLFKQLSEVKKINQLVGRRYFIEDSPLQTNFTTN